MYDGDTQGTDHQGAHDVADVGVDGAVQVVGHGVICIEGVSVGN